jgi:NitT/TauT family transport system substrate-binding protein
VAVSLGLLLGLASAGDAGVRKDRVVLQLKWVTQAQFAGYYAAKAKGFYDKLGLDVTIRPGGTGIVPEKAVLDGQAQFGIDWLASLLATRARGGKIVNVAQVFGRSGVVALTWRDSGLSSFCSLRGKRVGVWLDTGNEYEALAALEQCGIDPYDKKQVTIVPQSFSMDPFLSRKLDAASAMTYNELGLVLEQRNPKTGKLYSLEDLNVFGMEALGTGMLEDGIFAGERWLGDARNRDVARRFLQASLQGWVYCRDHSAECVDLVLQADPALARGHQRWQMNEINALIWPAKQPIGIVNPAAYARTVRLAQQFKLVKKAPAGAYRTDLAQAAVDALRRQHVDVLARWWKKPLVRATPGGR